MFAILLVLSYGLAGSRWRQTMRIKPFRAVRPAEDLADKVASPPYDVLSVKKLAIWQKKIR
jgi:hypothetical protein